MSENGGKNLNLLNLFQVDSNVHNRDKSIHSKDKKNLDNGWNVWNENFEIDSKNKNNGLIVTVIDITVVKTIHPFKE